MTNGNPAEQTPARTNKKLIFGIVLLVLGLIGFGWSTWTFQGHQVWASELTFDRDLRSPIVELPPGSQTRIGIFLRAQPTNRAGEKQSDDFAFPLSYQVFDRSGAEVIAEQTVVSSSGESISRSITKGRVTSTTLFKIFTVPQDGAISIAYRLSSADNFHAFVGSEPRIRLFNPVVARDTIVLVFLLSMGLLLTGTKLALT